MPKSKLSFPWLAAQLGLTLAAGLCLAVAYSLHPWWPAAWLAPLFLIGAVSIDALCASWVGALAGAIALSLVLGYYVSFSPVAAVIVAVLRILEWFGAARLAKKAQRTLPLGVAMLVLPAFMAAFECLTFIVSPHGAAGSLAYSQMDALPVIQAAAWGGIPAIVFITLLPGSFLAMWVATRPPVKPVIWAVAGLAAIAAPVITFAGYRLSETEARTVPVTVIATDRLHGIPDDWNTVWAVYAPVLQISAATGGVTVLPEKIALLPRDDAKRAAQQISEIAVARHSTIVVGLEVKDGVLYRNRAVIAQADGRIDWYDKQRPVPGLEARDVPGREPLVVAAQTQLGIAICKDMHFPDIGRQYAAKAAIMAVPAWDFGQDGWMGARMTMLRGVENGYAIARSARDGVIGAYDRFGRVIAEATPGDGMSVVTAKLPAGGVATIYSRIGNAFAVICALITGFAVWWGRRQSA